jgi:hypothetical protein
MTASVTRLLTKRTYIIAFVLLALASPAAAIAAVGSGGKNPAPYGIGPAHEAFAPLQRPIDGFQAVVTAGAREIEAERQAAQRAERRQARERFEDLPGGVSIETLASIASCESGGDPAAVSSDGTYRGLFQFDYGTWESVGGHGDPAAAPAYEQDYRAALLYSRSGSSPWPVCG